MEFEPEHFQQAAGLVCYYGGNKFHYLHVSHDETHGKHLRVMSALARCAGGRRLHPADRDPAGGRSGLRVEVDEERLLLRLSASAGRPGSACRRLFDASILSDEAQMPGTPNFTGAFVGMACQDMAGTGAPADFDYFLYRERGLSGRSLRNCVMKENTLRLLTKVP